MKITINSGDIPKGTIKCVTYDNNSNPLKLFFSMDDGKSAQEISLAVTNLLGLIGHYNRTFKPSILSSSVINEKDVRFVIKGDELAGAIKFLQDKGIITASMSQIILKKINEGKEIEDINIVEVTPQS